MAAISASAKGASVVLIEKNPAIGRKILATGNGRCNITNKFAKVENYHGSNYEFIGKILKAFDQQKTMHFFENLGLILKEEDRGRMFPRTNQASSVVEILDHELARLGVDVRLNSEVKSIDKKPQWSIELANGQTINARNLILATGGKAAHQFGSSGDGLFWAKKLQLLLEQTYAALVPMETKETWVKEIQGLKAETVATVFVGSKIVSQKSGDLIFTHYGISGPAVMSQSGAVAPYVSNSDVYIELDFMKDYSNKQLDEILSKIFNASGHKNIKSALVGMVPANLISVILKQSEIVETKKVAEISKMQRQQIVNNLKELRLHITKLRSFKEAQVTRGGVSTDEINPDTLESKKIKGLYFAGEILDVDGDSGGFNLQWAWSSGYLAGKISSK